MATDNAKRVDESGQGGDMREEQAERVWQRLRSGLHTVVLSDAGSLSLIQCESSAVRLIVIDCGMHPQPLGALAEAQRRLAELLGTSSSQSALSFVPGFDEAADRVLSGLRRRLIGELVEQTPLFQVSQALEKLSQKSIQTGQRWALAFTRVERADADSLHLLSLLFARAMPVPLLLCFSSEPSPGAAQELLATARRSGGEECVIRYSESSPARVIQLPSLSAQVMLVLRGLAIAGAGCEVTVLSELLLLPEAVVLACLQEASDAGVAIADDGDGHFELLPDLASQIIAKTLPSVARSYHRRLASLLSDRQPPPLVSAATSVPASFGPSSLQPSARSLSSELAVPDSSASLTTPDSAVSSGSAETITLLNVPVDAAQQSEQSDAAASADTEQVASASERASVDLIPAVTEEAKLDAAPSLSDVVAPSESSSAVAEPAPGPSLSTSAEPASELGIGLHWPYPAAKSAAPAATQSVPSVPAAAATESATPSTASAAAIGAAPTTGLDSPRAPRLGRAARHLIEAGELDRGIERYLLAVEQALRVGALREAMALVERATRLLSELPDSDKRRLLRVRALCARGRIRWLGEGPDARFTLAGAKESLEQARALLSASDPAELRAQVSSQLAAVLVEIGDLPSLEAALRELSDTSRSLLDSGDGVVAARLLNDQAAVYVRIGDPVRAAHLLEESRRFFTSGRFGSDDERAALELAETEHLLARLPLHVASRPGREKDAVALGRSHAQEAAATYKRLGMRRELAHVLETLGRLETLGGRHEAAIAQLSLAAQIERELHDVLGLARTTAGMADVLMAAGQLGGALALLLESLALNVEKGSPIGLAFVRRSVERIAERLTTELAPNGLLQERRAVAQLLEQIAMAEQQLGRVRLPAEF
jgi:tetratricopeptide (TPR) repeat protein